jgi:hypothetical protein
MTNNFVILKRGRKIPLPFGQILYCGVFTPCKNCNIETRSHDYETVDEAVFSPCRRASPRLVCCQATAWNTWMTQESGKVTWTCQQWRHALQQWCSNWSVSRVSDQEFIGETKACLRVSSWWEIAGVLGRRQPWKVRSWRRSDHVNWRL